MRIKLMALLWLVFFIGPLVSATNAQTADPDVIKRDIATLEAKNIDDFAASLQKIYKENLLDLYRKYLAALNRQINLLEGVPDPRGDFARKRTEYVNSRTQTQEKIGVLESNLGIEATRANTPTDSQLRTSGDGTSGNTPANANSDCPPVPSIESQTNAFTAAPPVLLDEARTASVLTVELIGNTDEPPNTALAGRLPDLFAYTVARAIVGESDTESPIVNIEPLRYLPEAYRTDKQVGSSATNSASTSAIDKPSLPALLGFAIENGFVERNVQDTVLTLSTSPVAFLAIRDRKFVDAYQNNPFLSRFGVSASFNINNENPLLANATRSQLREYSIRFRFLGDRSPNSKDFQKIWEGKIKPEISRLLAAEGRVTRVIDESESLRNLRNCVNDALAKALNTRLETQTFKALTREQKITDLQNFYLNYLKIAVYDRIRNGQFQVKEADQKSLSGSLENLLKTQRNAAFDSIKMHLDNFFKQPTGTFAYINHRNPLGNFSEFKLILDTSDNFLKPHKLTANAGFSFYHNPNPMMNQRKIRDFSFAVSFEGKTDSPFTEPGDLSQINYSFTGRYERFKENEGQANRKADLLKGQFLVNFPIFRGFILPVSLTYSNATELERKAGLRVNFGLKLDTDKLLAITRALSVIR